MSEYRPAHSQAAAVIELIGGQRVGNNFDVGVGMITFPRPTSLSECKPARHEPDKTLGRQ